MLAAISHDWGRRLVVAAAVLAGSYVLSRVLRWRIESLAQQRTEDLRVLRRLRARETAAIGADTLLRYGVVVFLAFWILGIFVTHTAAAIGGASLVVIVVGFGAQRILQDLIAGFLVLFEGWYAVGDFVELRPMEVTGFVEQVGLRTTVVRSLNGDRTFVPNSQIFAAIRSPRGYRTYTIELVTTDAKSAREAVESAAGRMPTGQARFLREPHVVEERELPGGAWLVRAQADVPPSLEWLAEGLLDALLKAQIAPGELLAGPVVYTLDEEAVARYERRVLVR
jgi:hypothetical protein